MIALPPFLARVEAHDRLRGRVVHIDHFGNVVTTIHASQLPPAPLVVQIGAHHIDTFVRTYGGAAGLIALVGSSGYLEIAEVNGDAAARLAVLVGQDVLLETTA